MMHFIVRSELSAQTWHNRNAWYALGPRGQVKSQGRVGPFSSSNVISLCLCSLKLTVKGRYYCNCEHGKGTMFNVAKPWKQTSGF